MRRDAIRRRAGGAIVSTFTAVDVFEVEHCCTCGVAFAMTANFQQGRLSSKGNFYCPAGHVQHYTGMSDKDRAQRLAGQLDMERTRRQQAEKEADYATRSRKAVSTRLRKVKQRVGNGVCPCCNRTFKQLAAHMSAQHPTYADEVQS
jgi:hypothetical protein